MCVLKNRSVPFIYPLFDRVFGRPRKDAESINYVYYEGCSEETRFLSRWSSRRKLRDLAICLENVRLAIRGMPNCEQLFRCNGSRKVSVFVYERLVEKILGPWHAFQVFDEPISVESAVDKCSRCYNVAVHNRRAGM